MEQDEQPAHELDSMVWFGKLALILQQQTECIRILREQIADDLYSMRNDINLCISVLMLTSNIHEDKMDALRQVANKNIQILRDPAFIEQLQKGKASMGDIFERKAPPGSVKI